MARTDEIGRIGQKRFGGTFYEEFLRDLRGKKGIETYREMAENDDTIGAILFAIEMLIRQASGGRHAEGQRSGGVRRTVYARHAGYLDGHNFRDSVISDIWLVLP